MDLENLSYVSMLGTKYPLRNIVTIWAARQQAPYLQALSTTPEADPGTLRILQRRCHQPRLPSAVSPPVFYAVRLGHVPGIYTSWKEAQPQTVGIHTDFKRFTSRPKAEAYMAMTSGPGNPLLDDPVAFLFTDGSALPNGTAGWGVHITYPERTDTRGLWGHVVTSARVPNWVGAFAATSNTGELSGMYHALDWINSRHPPTSPVARPRYNIVSDSDNCVKLFATRSIKPVANKRMIARIDALLARVKQTNDVSISWTPSHTKEDSPLARGNAEADLLAARGCVAPCLSRSLSTGLPSVAPRPRSSKARPPRRSSDSALLRRTRGVRGSPRQDPRLPPFDRRQPPLWRAFFLRLAMRFRPASACHPPMCEYNGDLVGD